MGLQRFQTARRASGPPEIAEFDIEATATFSAGAPVQRDATPNFIEEFAGGAVVVGIVGVALFGVEAGVPAGKGSTAFGTRVLIEIANHDQEFWGQLTNGGSVVSPSSADEGVEYGVLEVGGEWFVDQADTGDVVLTVTRAYPEIDTVLFKFLASAVSV
jgi:hypothetical protein